MIQTTEAAVQARQASFLLVLGVLAILIGTMVIWGIALFGFFAIGWTIYAAVRLCKDRPALGITLVVLATAAVWIAGHTVLMQAWHETVVLFAQHPQDRTSLLLKFAAVGAGVVFIAFGAANRKLRVVATGALLIVGSFIGTAFAYLGYSVDHTTGALVQNVTIRAPKAELHVQVARTIGERENGLMYRTSLPAHTGMIFVFNRDAQVEFWMKDTRIPLDMVFVSDKGVVRSVAANVPVVPLGTPDGNIPRRAGRARYVIELPANEASRDGLKPGVRINGVTDSL